MSDSHPNEPKSVVPNFLVDGGETGAFIAARDWSRTSLGPIEGWPQSLRTMTALLLRSAVPMVMLWGEDGIMLYNDAYSVFAGGRHPRLLGSKVREGWPEVAAFNDNVMKVGLAGGTLAYRDQELTLHRHGRPEKVWMDLDYSPVLDESGRPAGVLAIVVETTGRVTSERQRGSAEANLKAERDRAQGVLDNMGEAFVLLDRDYRIVDMNAEAMRLESRPREAILGKTHWEAHPNAAPELGELYRHAMVKRSAVALEHRYVWPDGREAWIDMRAYPVAEGLAVFYRDVGDRKRAEASLRASEAKFEAIANSIDQMIWSTRSDGHHDYYNQRWYDYTGIPEGSTDGEAWNGMFHPDDQERARASWRRSLATGEPYHIEYRLRHRSGQYRWVLGRAQAVRDEAGRVARWYGTCTDVHDLKAAEDALRESRDRLAAETQALEILNATGTQVAAELGLESLVQKVVDAGVALTEARFGAFFYNVLDERGESYMLYALSGADRSQFDDFGMPRATSVFAPTFRGEGVIRSADILADARYGKNAPHAGMPKGHLPVRSYLAVPVTSRSGEVIGGLLFGHEEPDVFTERSERVMAGLAAQAAIGIDNARLFEAAQREIEERRNAEARLRDSEARLRAVFEAVPVGIVLADAPSGRITGGNGQIERILGHPVLPSADVGDYGAWVSRHADGRIVQAQDYPLAKIVRGESDRAELEVLYRRGDGRDAWVRFIAAPVRDEAGRVTGGVVASLDVDRERRADEALRHLNETLERQVEERTAALDRVWTNSRDLLVVIGADGVFRAINPAWTTILGHEPREVIGRSFLDFIWPEDADLTQGGLDTAARERDLTNFENRYAHKDGSPRWISWRTATEGEFVYAYGRDVTAEKEQAEALAAAQEALRQAQKMEAVGQLTGGIAHDFNNMLAVVIGSLDLLGRRIGVGDPRVKRYVDAATDGARRAALLTQRLLAFSRQQPLRPEPVNVNALVAGMSDLLRHSLGSDIRLETVLAGGLWRTRADPNQLENVILNLAVNARDAMPDGGRLTIETQNAHLDGRYVAAHLGVTAGQYVLIAVTDTGSGMPADVIAKAFDPFFTTKDIGKGTGLGLSQVYGFVKQSGGHVKIYSEPGHGTTLKVYLPRLVGVEQEAPGVDRSSELPRGDSHEVVLVVEDQDAVRQFSVDALSELGYRVLEADGAAAGLRLLDAHPEIALLFTDVVMPDVNGAKLADAARQRRPDLRVLFTTGYTRDAIVHNGVLDPGVSLIGKPFTVEELAAKVREVLDQPASRTGGGNDTR